jgi:hypothetical protein
VVLSQEETMARIGRATKAHKKETCIVKEGFKLPKVVDMECLSPCMRVLYIYTSLYWNQCPLLAQGAILSTLSTKRSAIIRMVRRGKKASARCDKPSLRH